MASPAIVERKAASVEAKVEELAGQAFFALIESGRVGATAESAFRRDVKAAGGRFSVQKNSLMSRVLDRLEMDAEARETMGEALSGLTAHVTAKTDPFPVLKVIRAFGKANNGVYAVKAGLLDGQLVAGERLARLAKIESISQIYGMVVGYAQAPVAGLAGVLEGVLGEFVWTLEQIKEARQ
ncbi:50S ribosomal protein L10 [bacterium]|nr:50S ribosomal protein L10 [bacterium]